MFACPMPGGAAGPMPGGPAGPEAGGPRAAGCSRSLLGDPPPTQRRVRRLGGPIPAGGLRQVRAVYELARTSRPCSGEAGQPACYTRACVAYLSGGLVWIFLERTWPDTGSAARYHGRGPENHILHPSRKLALGAAVAIAAGPAGPERPVAPTLAGWIASQSARWRAEEGRPWFAQGPAAPGAPYPIARGCGILERSDVLRLHHVPLFAALEDGWRALDARELALSPVPGLNAPGPMAVSIRAAVEPDGLVDGGYWLALTLDTPMAPISLTTTTEPLDLAALRRFLYKGAAAFTFNAVGGAVEWCWCEDFTGLTVAHIDTPVFYELRNVVLQGVEPFLVSLGLIFLLFPEGR